MDATGLVYQVTASVLTLLGQWLYGSKNKWAPIIGLAAQGPWWLIMIHSGLWGLLPVNFAMLVIHARNAWKWWHDANQG